MGESDAARLLDAVRPLVERTGGAFVDPDDLEPGDVPLRWDGTLVAGVRLGGTATDPGSAAELAAPNGLAGLIGEVERSLGGGLAELPRPRKQQAVRMLEERGAFSYRKAVETVAEALGVTRFTVYNYLNRRRS